jgi:hypothetical protein
MEGNKSRKNCRVLSEKEKLEDIKWVIRSQKSLKENGL